MPFIGPLFPLFWCGIFFIYSTLSLMLRIDFKCRVQFFETYLKTVQPLRWQTHMLFGQCRLESVAAWTNQDLLHGKFLFKIFRVDESSLFLARKGGRAAFQWPQCIMLYSIFSFPNSKVVLFAVFFQVSPVFYKIFRKPAYCLSKSFSELRKIFFFFWGGGGV